MAGHPGRQAALVLYCARRLAGPDDCRLEDEWRDRATGETLKSCTMIITEPNAFVAEVHDRMPALLAEKDFEPWLSGAAGIELLRPAPDDLLQRWPVSKRVNSSKASAEDATLIDRIVSNLRSVMTAPGPDALAHVYRT